MTEIPEDTDSVHLTAPVPSEVFTTRESLRERCDMFVRCLPQAPMRDRLARLFEELLAPQWQSIATAPKDGRGLLLGHFNSHGNWRTVRGEWCSAEAIAESWEDPDAPEGWYETSVESDHIPNCWWTDPTHWMPLPAAPHHRSADTERHGSDKPDSAPNSSIAAQGMAQDAARSALEIVDEAQCDPGCSPEYRKGYFDAYNEIRAALRAVPHQPTGERNGE